MNKNQKMNTAHLEISDEESMILEEEIDENYQPTQEEIIEYAQFLGMDLKEDQDLFHIAREGLKSPLPEVWKPAKNRNGDIYYINLKTKEAQWEHPCDEHYKKVYQEAKKKKKNKVQSKVVSKFKSNFAVMNSSSPSTKSSGLPIIKDLSRDEDELVKRENNNIFEIQDIASLNNQEPSIDSSPKRLINKKPGEKTQMGGRHAEPTIIHNIDLDVQKDDFTEIDDEYDRKFFLYKQEKEKSLRKAKEELKAEENSRYDEMEQGLGGSLDVLKSELIRKVEIASKAFVENKQKIQEDMTLEHHKNLESQINQIEEEKEKRISKIKNETQEEIEMLEADESEKAIKENEARILKLKEEKDSVETEKSNFGEKKKFFEENQNKKVEEEKKKFIDDLKNQLNSFAIEEAERQQEELKNYQKSLEVKLNEEKSTLLVAKQKTESIQIARNSDLKGKYDRIFEIEKEKIENEMRQNLNSFEIAERKKKDENLAELEEAELQILKDKKQNTLQKELQTLKETYKRRLNSYEVQLKEKMSNEKQNIESEIKLVEQKFKHEVDNIRTDLNNQEQIFEQIKMTEQAEEEISNKVQEVNKKIGKQQNENKELREKLESLQRKSVQQANNKNEAIKELESQIKQMESKIAKLKENNKPSYLSPTSLRNSNILNGNKKEFPYVKIIEDIEEIKTILTTQGDEKEQTVSSLIFRKGEGSRLPSPKLGAMTPHKGIFLSHVKSNSQLFTLENKWKNIYVKECDNIADIKDRIKECKNKIAKKQNTLLKKQGKLKKDCQKYHLSESKNIQKRTMLKDLKHNLDKQVQKMNLVMFKMRDADLMFEKKNELFKEFEQMIYGDLDHIQMVYDEYSKIHVVVPILEDNEGEEFYEVWENILENQSALETNFESHSSSEKKSFASPMPTTWEKSIKNMRDSFYFENKLQLSQGFGQKGALQYSYDNLFSVLDQQTKSFEYERESQSLKQKQSPSHFREQHDQVSSLFLNHSTWLQDMKQKLNYQLYDKPASLPSKDIYTSGRTLY